MKQEDIATFFFFKDTDWFYMLYPRFNIGWLSYYSDSEQHLLTAAFNMWQEM